MRILIVGAGGLGGFFGGLLARGGQDVVFVARGEKLRALQTHGLTVDSVQGDFSLRVSAVGDAREAGTQPFDLVVLATKAYSLDTVIPSIKPVVGADTLVLTLQNGVDVPDRVRAGLSRGQVVAGLTRAGATLVAPGKVVHTTDESEVVLGPWGEDDPEALSRAIDVMRAAGVPVERSPDIRAALWEKLVFISAMSGLATITGLHPGVLLVQPATRSLYRAMLQETTAVARGAGVLVDGDCVEKILTYLDGVKDVGESSMAVDFRNGRPIEIEAIHGAVVRHGRKHGIKTPLNDFVYSSLLVMSAAREDDGGWSWGRDRK